MAKNIDKGQRKDLYWTVFYPHIPRVIHSLAVFMGITAIVRMVIL